MRSIAKRQYTTVCHTNEQPAAPKVKISSALWNQTQAFLHRSKRTGSPLDYVRESIQHKVLKQLQSAYGAAIVLGDLNSGWFPEDGGSHKGLREWAKRSHLISSRLPPATKAERKAQCTFTRKFQGVSHIDHILITAKRGIRPVLTTTLTDTGWGFTDHRPPILDLRINNFSTDALRNRKRTKPYKAPPPD